MDVYICESNKESSQILGDYCIRYFIQENIEADIQQIQNFEQLKDKLISKILLNIFMVGIEKELKIISEHIKNCNDQNYIILLGSDTKELFACITPALRPSGMLLRPVEAKMLYQTLDEIWNDYKSIEDESKQFIFNVKAAKYVVPNNKILYFESNSKKILLRTIAQEFDFYGSIQKIAEELPENFVRVHRSFIVNINKISEVDFGENIIYFGENTFVYFSRSYKVELQECLKRQK